MTVPFPLALAGVKFTVSGSSLRFGRDVLSFKPDKGRAMERARSTVVDDDMSLSCSLNASEYLAMSSFYKTTTRTGTLPFAMVDPDSGGVATFQFTSAPQFMWLGNGYRACSFEVLRFGK